MLDARDQAILTERTELFSKREVPSVGDYVIFANGITRRISYDWKDAVQTSDGGSFYLCSSGAMSFSGSLYRSIPVETLTLTDETKSGSCWFFHHNYAMAHNGVYVTVPCRVWRCSLDANQ